MDIIADEKELKEETERLSEKVLKNIPEDQRKEARLELLNSIQNAFEFFKNHNKAWEIYYKWAFPEGMAEEDLQRIGTPDLCNVEAIRESFARIDEEITELGTPVSFQDPVCFRLAEAVRAAAHNTGDDSEMMIRRNFTELILTAELNEIIGFVEWIHPETNTGTSPLKNLKNYGFQHDKLSRYMVKTKPTVTKGVSAWAVDKSPKIKGSTVPVYAHVSYVNDKKKLPGNISAFDISLINAIGTLWHNSPKRARGVNMSVGEIFRAMHGITDTRKSPTKAQSDEICEAIERLMYSKFNLDFSHEIEAYGLKIDDERIIQGKVETNMLHAYALKVKTVKGRFIEMYKILDEPILYTYSRLLNHLIIVPYELLDVSDQTRFEGNTLEIRDYLICEIDSMYNTISGRTAGRFSNVIKFQTMYETIGIKSPEDRISPENYKSRVIYTKALSREKKKERDKVAAILESLKKKAFIRGYEINKSVPSIQITLDPKIIEKKKKTPLSWM